MSGFGQNKPGGFGGGGGGGGGGFGGGGFGGGAAGRGSGFGGGGQQGAGGFGTPPGQKAGGFGAAAAAGGGGGGGGGFGGGGFGGGAGGFGAGRGAGGGGFGAGGQQQQQQQQQQQTGLGVGGFGTPAPNRAGGGAGGFGGGGGGGGGGFGGGFAQQQQQQRTQQQVPPSYSDPSRQTVAGRYLLRIDSTYNALDPQCRFRAFFYNFCTPGQGDQAIARERLVAQQLGGGCTEEQWLTAKRENPDSENMYPVPVHFIAGLRDRVRQQKTEIERQHSFIDQLQRKVDHLRALRDENEAKHKKLVLEQAMIERKLLGCTAHAEALRQFGLPLGQERHTIVDRTAELLRRINSAGSFKAQIADLERPLEAEVQRFAKRLARSGAGKAHPQQHGPGLGGRTGGGGSSGAQQHSQPQQPLGFGGIDAKKRRPAGNAGDQGGGGGGDATAGDDLRSNAPITGAAAVAAAASAAERDVDAETLRSWNQFLARMEDGIGKLKKALQVDRNNVIAVRHELAQTRGRRFAW